MNRSRLIAARAAVPSTRAEKNRVSALASRQKMLDETELLATRVLYLESQVQSYKQRLSRYESTTDEEDAFAFAFASAASAAASVPPFPEVLPDA